MTGLSAIPITGAALSAVHVMSSTRFAVHLKEAFETMESSLNKTHENYQKCSEMLDKTITATTVIKTTSFGFSLAGMIPGVGLALIPPRITESLAAMLVIRDGLSFWQNNGCQYATSDCNL
ncbi:uncharacterized protein LOC107885906 [Acyrthosiphon pisum]|uniref:Uncharacterized protein n=1 Tax=Acyrthosiphon pisum TaxID=7029 RepID=A0A8R2D8E0_ACYPI|nr:uncharacterized protein LOC107885906 [Acyrthosiphon pisum]|eukprot:XP_016665163.1 PREDICTED: uncharacterized protein LOC107885906 [Acyrthosiphon pisum]